MYADEHVDEGFAPTRIGVAADAAVDWLAGYRRAVNSFGGACDSPIEEMLGAALLAGRPDGLDVVSQFRWSIYRSDFALLYGERVLLVECDGAKFHSSPDQRAHDATKDKAAAIYGMPTLRFTGSEIFADAALCAYLCYAEVMR